MCKLEQLLNSEMGRQKGEQIENNWVGKKRTGIRKAVMTVLYMIAIEDFLIWDLKHKNKLNKLRGG
jgi:hypothetical protein